MKNVRERFRSLKDGVVPNVSGRSQQQYEFVETL
jgi:hypothetical protein